jgi:hypothetical protein
MLYIGEDNIKERYSDILEQVDPEVSEGMSFLIMNIQEFCSLLSDYLVNLKADNIAIYVYPSEEEAKEAIIEDISTISDEAVHVNIVPSLAFAIEHIGKL